MYICENCGKTVEEIGTAYQSVNGWLMPIDDLKCPHCGSSVALVPAKECSICEEYKAEEEIDDYHGACKDCSNKVLSLFRNFISGLTVNQASYLNDYFDGRDLNE